jgi:hypothetical protein
MIIAKFIPLCICALLITEAAAQLDFGTYEIINRASQSSLCSHETGERIYVSTQGYPCARELWELGPGDDHGLYTIKNIGLNSCVHASKMSGSPVVTSDGRASFEILSNEGYGHIIKFPSSDLVWTVVPTEVSRTDILLQPESGDDTQIWTLILTNDTITHRPFAIQARYSKEEERNLATLRGIEKLGGSAGYQQYLESPNTIPNFTHIATLTSDTFTNSMYASGDLESYFLYTEISIVAGGYSGKGHAWGVGVGVIGFVGVLGYDSWEELTSAENGITIVGGGLAANLVVIVFSIDGHDVAALTIGGLGASAILGVHGTLKWTRT